MEPYSENVKTVRRNKEEKKLLRKQIKASHTLLKHEGISTVTQPTKSLVVANGGLGNGVSREQLQDVLGEVGEVETLVMPPHKPYALVTYRSEVSAQRGHAQQRTTAAVWGPDCHTVPELCQHSGQWVGGGVWTSPQGWCWLKSFVSPEEEALLLDAIDWTSHDEDVTGLPQVCVPCAGEGV
ncbi:hypothetical protein J4Q44_G00338840 [Coregonus suidteri]|uniref:Uncharacterized protein n=1 Tax=Coregonus suidteri TaxID=861788 RepID=A0AAN8L0I5_9TELE